MKRLPAEGFTPGLTVLAVLLACAAGMVGSGAMDVPARAAGSVEDRQQSTAKPAQQKPTSKPAQQKPTSKPAPQKPSAKPAAKPVAPPAVPSPVLSSGNFSPIVADLEKTITFYRRVVGLEVLGAAPEGGRPFDSTTPVLDTLGVRGAEMRSVTALIPKSARGVEIVELGKLERTPLEPKPQDPGATTLVLVVRDIEPIFSRALSAGAPIVTTGGVPIGVPSEGGGAILLRDPDGHFIEVVQANPPPKEDGPNIISWHVRLTVESTDEALRLYRDQFGLPARSGTLAKNKAFTTLNGLDDVPVRLTTITLPLGDRLDLAEYGGVTRKPIGARIQDPGATRFQLHVKDVREAAELAKKAGATIVSQDGGIIELAGGAMATVARDPNNLFLVLISSVQ